MGGVHQGFEVVRPAVARIGCKEKNAVVAPIAAAGEVGQWHQLQRRDAEIDQVIEGLGEAAA